MTDTLEDAAILRFFALDTRTYEASALRAVARLEELPPK